MALDVTDRNFDAEVIEASAAQAVVVDFWAPWCGPCRALTPVLERVSARFAGKVKLVKLNVDENPRVAGQFGIRSIPDVVAFRGGRPVARFMGAQPEGQVEAFFQKLLPSASEEALLRAETQFAAGRVDEAERELASVREDPDWEARVAALRQGIAYARAQSSGPGEPELRSRLAERPSDHEARLALATLCAGQKRYREALEELLEIVRRDKDWREGEAKRQVLAIFGLAAGTPDLVAEFRKKLAAALY